MCHRTRTLLLLLIIGKVTLKILNHAYIAQDIPAKWTSCRLSANGALRISLSRFAIRSGGDHARATPLRPDGGRDGPVFVARGVEGRGEGGIDGRVDANRETAFSPRRLPPFCLPSLPVPWPPLPSPARPAPYTKRTFTYTTTTTTANHLPTLVLPRCTCRARARAESGGRIRL